MAQCFVSSGGQQDIRSEALRPRMTLSNLPMLQSVQLAGWLVLSQLAPQI
jgi:hypothetical protein